MAFDFSEAEIQRYARHILLKEVGGTGQAKLQAGSVLIVGAGGLGSPLALYLAAAGVGRIGICDADTLELSNLQRQIAHTTDGVGQKKSRLGGRRDAPAEPGGGGRGAGCAAGRRQCRCVDRALRHHLRRHG